MKFSWILEKISEIPEELFLGLRGFSEILNRSEVLNVLEIVSVVLSGGLRGV